MLAAVELAQVCRNQSGVMIVGYSYGYFQGKDLFRIGLALTVVEFIILAFLVPFYWPLIGIR